jgi:outer membrane protein assembly factor BamE (lipoprotein component of BamABCDE complex)
MQAFSTRLIIAAVLVGASVGCSPMVDLRGDQIPPEVLAEVTPGHFTKSDVQALLGTPSTMSNFGDDAWYYIGGKTETLAFFAPEEIDRHVIVINFDKAGKVTSVHRLGLKDGKDVNIATEETPTAGKEMTVLEQLLGNVGKFNSSSKVPGGTGQP